MNSPRLRSLTSTASRPARIAGGINLVAARTGRGSGVERLSERGGYRARVVHEGDRCDAVLLNPAGGLVGGDQIALDLTVNDGAQLTVTTAAAERVYRSDGPDAEVRCRLTAATGTVLEWLPQQTVFYDGCRYRRQFEVEAALDARVMVLEMLALGRHASGEVLGDVMIKDHWRIRRGGRLVLAEALRLAGPVTAMCDHPAVGAGARASATLAYVTPVADTDVERVRACLGDATLCGASAVDGVVIARWLATEPMELVAALQAFLVRFRGCPAPRGW